MSRRALLGPARGWVNVYTMGLAHFISDFYCNILPLMLPILARRFGLSYAECGSIYMVFQVAANFIQPPLGLLADRRNLNYLMPLSILGGGVFACAIGDINNFYLLVLVIFVSGICASGFHPIAGGIMPHVSPPGKEVQSTSVFIVGGNIGFAVAPTCVALFIAAFGHENLIWLSLPAVATTGLIFSRRLHHPTMTAAPKNISSLSSMLHDRSFVWLVLSVGCRALCYCTLIGYLPLFLTARGYSGTESSTALLALLSGTAFGGMTVGGLAFRFGLKYLILMTYIVTLASVSGFLYLADLSALSYVLLFLTGAGMYGSTPAAIVWLQRLVTQSAAFATSMILGFTFGMGYIVSVLTGVLADAFSLYAALWITIIPALLLAIAILLPLKEPAAGSEET